MWRPSDPNDKRTEDVILHEDFDTCPPISSQRRRRRGDHRHRREGPVVATTNQLWPYSQISATVATLNSANVGYQSDPIEIVTPEGRKYTFHTGWQWQALSQDLENVETLVKCPRSLLLPKVQLGVY